MLKHRDGQKLTKKAKTVHSGESYMSSLRNAGSQQNRFYNFQVFIEQKSQKNYH